MFKLRYNFYFASIAYFFYFLSCCRWPDRSVYGLQSLERAWAHLLVHNQDVEWLQEEEKGWGYVRTCLGKVGVLYQHMMLLIIINTTKTCYLNSNIEAHFMYCTVEKIQRKKVNWNSFAQCLNLNNVGDVMAWLSHIYRYSNLNRPWVPIIIVFTIPSTTKTYSFPEEILLPLLFSLPFSIVWWKAHLIFLLLLLFYRTEPSSLLPQYIEFGWVNKGGRRKRWVEGGGRHMLKEPQLLQNIKSPYCTYSTGLQ